MRSMFIAVATLALVSCGASQAGADETKFILQCDGEGSSDINGEVTSEHHRYTLRFDLDAGTMDIFDPVNLVWQDRLDIGESYLEVTPGKLIYRSAYDQSKDMFVVNRVLGTLHQEASDLWTASENRPEMRIKISFDGNCIKVTEPSVETLL